MSRVNLYIPQSYEEAMRHINEQETEFRSYVKSQKVEFEEKLQGQTVENARLQAQIKALGENLKESMRSQESTGNEMARQYASAAVQCIPIDESAAEKEGSTIVQLRETLQKLEKKVAEDSEKGKARHVEHSQMQEQVASMGKEIVSTKEENATLAKELEEMAKQNRKLKEVVQAVHKATELDQVLGNTTAEPA